MGSGSGESSKSVQVERGVLFVRAKQGADTVKSELCNAFKKIAHRHGAFFVLKLHCVTRWSSCFERIL